MFDRNVESRNVLNFILRQVAGNADDRMREERLTDRNGNRNLARLCMEKRPGKLAAKLMPGHYGRSRVSDVL